MMTIGHIIEGFQERYFPLGEITYPDPTRDPLMPVGELWTYISSTFLNGWINYVEPRALIAMPRYTSGEDFYRGVKHFKQLDDVHTSLGEIGDDVVVLGEDEGGRWWFFYFDCDVSDCWIGRMVSTGSDPTEDVIQYCRALTVQRAKGGTQPESLHVDLMTGWISF